MQQRLHDAESLLPKTQFWRALKRLKVYASPSESRPLKSGSKQQAKKGEVLAVQQVKDKRWARLVGSSEAWVPVKLNGETVLELLVDPSLLDKGSLEGKYKLGAVLGKGAFGEVRKAVHKKSKREVAVKILNKDHPEFDAEEVTREVRLMRALGGHANIVGCHELYESSQCYSLVLELVSGGDLFSYVVEKDERGEGFSERNASTIARQVISALQHCHRIGIVHRDLKPENVLVTSDEHGSPLVKLADFGLAAVIDPGSGRRLRQKCGTAEYVAPEVMAQPDSCTTDDVEEGEGYDERVDIYSCGVMLYILLCGFPPYDGLPTTEVVKRGLALDFPSPEWDPVSEDAKRVLRMHMLGKDPARRRGASDLMLHPWISGKTATDADLTLSVAKLDRFNRERRFQAKVRAKPTRQMRAFVRGLHGVADGGSLEAEAAYVRFAVGMPRCQRLLASFAQGAEVVDRTAFMSTVRGHVFRSMARTTDLLPSEGSLLPKEEAGLAAVPADHYEAFKDPNGQVNFRDYVAILCVLSQGALSEKYLSLQAVFENNGEFSQPNLKAVLKAIVHGAEGPLKGGELDRLVDEEWGAVDARGHETVGSFLQGVRQSAALDQYLRSAEDLNVGVVSAAVKRVRQLSKRARRRSVDLIDQMTGGMLNLAAAEGEDDDDDDDYDDDDDDDDGAERAGLEKANIVSKSSNNLADSPADDMTPAELAAFEAQQGKRGRHKDDALVDAILGAVVIGTLTLGAYALFFGGSGRTSMRMARSTSMN